ncbi:hypothetical protein FO522_33535, partial [Bacillus nitratireducens]|nr:hypothetical protein [Bacillus nitratireducens]
LQAADVTFLLGIKHVQLGHERLALPFLQKATELDERDVQAVFQCVLYFAVLEQLKEAKTYFEYVFEMNEKHLDAYYNLGVS